ncbi:energy-coupling factor ABC transporter ATP-binding protein [Geoalkalibacter halelectricus]|uniref:ATP-binding cassette domain-containing protein n=1 Tax=Geoalkalibacter halelectricus TaxID=2847045 RepID=A0ABY5ZIG3_9BACT|nr:ATP-binding cassette domain-containing protein [Geoalkalibacter halelectricus]MDO3377292.1 ATP-binding cassette domain-containing protein [Geoalkalibacter halelectricus]UWZ78930.1 ATP-binding cassette domain-containing protein [Geoalkalibacter halelectricus]
MALLTLSNIEIGYPGGFNLWVNHLALEEGRIYILSGPNGAGKSTLLQTLALLNCPRRGEIRVGDERLTWRGAQLRRLRRRITLVHQNPFLFSGSIQHNLAMGLALRGIRGDEQRRRIEQSLEAVGLSEFARRPARKLSGGETRRVALARALALRPDILLLDEPTANLDRETVATFEEVIQILPAQGITVVMASHDPGQPQRLGGELLRLGGGRLMPA